MPNEMIIDDDNHVDDAVDAKIAECLKLETPKSFFLFAGAGSGKTRSLVKALESITACIGEKLRIRGQQVGVITYTNNACDEIKRRLSNDALIHVSTIHSFVWDLICGFDSDIKKRLVVMLKEDITKLESNPSREGTKTEINRIHKIESKQQRLRELDKIKKFTYNPNSDNTERDALNHSEVLQLGAYFLTTKALMQRILIKKFPILLIDESQDTNKVLMEAFLVVQKGHRDEFSLGLLGDTMQRIYGDGKPDLGIDLPRDWEITVKKMNHRSQSRIIELINKIRSDVDSQRQQGRQDKRGGYVRLFAVQSGQEEAVEKSVMQQMATITGDEEWNKQESVASLILEHHMAAKRMGFGEMFAALYFAEEFRLGLLDGTLPEIRIFSEIILPIVESHKAGDKFAIANVVKKHSKLFNKRYVNEHRNELGNIFKTANAKVMELCSAYDDNPNITFGEFLRIVDKGDIFEIPQGYKPILLRSAIQQQAAMEVTDAKTDTSTESSSDKIDCLDSFLNTKFSQIKEYVSYIREQSPFFTHQGVKGLEFPRVMAIIDDSEARGFLFSYEKLFGIKDVTATDIKNANEGKETGMDRTRRLFYVICSRAEKSLAIVAYSDNPKKLKDNLIGKGWFTDDEIIFL